MSLRLSLRPRFALPLAVALVTVASFSPALAADTTVTITNFAFGPEVTTVSPGTKVVFKNEDDTIHSVVADDGSWHSDGLDTGDTYTQTFAKAGTYGYHCGLHPFMKGQIVVK